ncbi:hypothetical protein E1301_Tti020870 [Triplophysa tibetana]|uniref:Uncharacterized protein n=1 Tax=Triplophysa tibetana TaxID=1572043 RepID=A0A5A9P706_9TELE|nr:hypothetical protein E1301_Tti020870 [Triplophysa tibetana]
MALEANKKTAGDEKEKEEEEQKFATNKERELYTEERKEREKKTLKSHRQPEYSKDESDPLESQQGRESLRGNRWRGPGFRDSRIPRKKSIVPPHIHPSFSNENVASPPIILPGMRPKHEAMGNIWSTIESVVGRS